MAEERFSTSTLTAITPWHTLKLNDIGMGSRPDNWRLPSEAYLTLPVVYATPEDEIKTKELAALVKDIETPYTKDMAMLYRFVRARSKDTGVPGAFEQFKEMAAMRVEMKVDELKEEDLPPLLTSKFYDVSGVMGHTEDGCFIHWQHTALEDFYGRFETVGVENILKNAAFQMDKLDYDMRELSVKKGKVCDRLFIVTDLQGLAMSLLTSYNRTAYSRRLQFLEKNFPERVKLVRIINAPGIFATAFELIKGILQEGTRQKINVLRDTMDLTEWIPAEEIPEYLGGKKRVMGDPYCRPSIRAARDFVKVPDGADQVAREDPKLRLSSTLMKTNVAAGYDFKDWRAVPSGTKLNWRLVNQAGYDIDFQIKLFQNGGPLEGEVVHEVKRAKGDMSGDLTATQDCTFEFRFDNSFSWGTSKDMEFSFSRA